MNFSISFEYGSSDLIVHLDSKFARINDKNKVKLVLAGRFTKVDIINIAASRC